MPPNTIYVGRGSEWGNPWHIAGKLTLSREEAIRRYRQVMLPLMRHRLRELRGKNLACWCKLTDMCHADLLLREANK